MSHTCWTHDQMNNTWDADACAQATIHSPVWWLCVLGVPGVVHLVGAFRQGAWDLMPTSCR